MALNDDDRARSGSPIIEFKKWIDFSYTENNKSNNYYCVEYMLQLKTNNTYNLYVNVKKCHAFVGQQNYNCLVAHIMLVHYGGRRLSSEILLGELMWLTRVFLKAL